MFNEFERTYLENDEHNRRKHQRVQMRQNASEIKHIQNINRKRAEHVMRQQRIVQEN